MLNRLVSETTADGFSDSYAYDNIGELTSYTNKRGQTITYTYDSDGRRTSRVTPEGTTTYTYDNNNNVLTITDEKGTITRTYDSLNRITSYTDAKGNTIGYEYDNVGNLITLTYPDSKIVRYSYNANNQLAKVQDWNNRITIYIYDNNGRLVKTERPNGTYQTYTYNEIGQLTYTIDQTTDGKIINEYSYEYDADGNIITEDSINEPNYDNITIPSSEMNYGSANRLIDFNGTAISYDNDGNMLNTPLKNNKWGMLVYNSQNMLIDVVTSDGVISFEYDAENNRTLKTEYGKTTSYVVNPNAELSQVLMSTTNGETTYYIYGLGLITEESNNGYKTYHYDYRGSTTAITNNNGNVTDRIYYDPYGSIINRMGITYTPFLYVGKYGIETDDNGLYYMRARYYNPQVQRFINIDPARDGYNWHNYCINNPINIIDICGLEIIIVSGGEYSLASSHGYKYNFIEPAIRACLLYRVNDYNETITWIIADKGYTEQDKQNFAEVLKSMDVKILYIKRTEELINYINHKENNNRSNDKINKFVSFSHGLIDKIDLGYNYVDTYNDLFWITKEDIKKVDANAFNNPNSCFWSCNTGTGGKSSIAQMWVNKVGGKTWAFKGKTYYGYIMHTKDCVDANPIFRKIFYNRAF